MEPMETMLTKNPPFGKQRPYSLPGSAL